MIEELTAGTLPAALPGLAGLLVACVEAGASIGFLPPMRPAEAAAYWEGLAGALATGERRMLLARDGRGAVTGTASLVLAGLPNGRHRAEVAKVMVHPAARRQGVGRALMLRLEALAREEGRDLLVLDTKSGEAAERLYRALGWIAVGEVPGYALEPGGRCATTFMYRALGGAPPDVGLVGKG
ncbi:N-acetyltransferase family protein [Teichococcus aerofrigidensis]